MDLSLIFLLQPFTLGNLSPRIFPGPRRGLQAFGPAERILIHEALTDLDCFGVLRLAGIIFQSTRPSRTSTVVSSNNVHQFSEFQSTRPSRTSTKYYEGAHKILDISIHEALTDLDQEFMAFA